MARERCAYTPEFDPAKHQRAVPSLHGSRAGNRWDETGVCWDNAQAETLVASLKIDCVYRTAIPTLDHARRTVGRYIEIFYNRRRRHSALDYQTPQQRYSQLTDQQAQAA